MALSRKFVDSEGVHWQVYELSTEGAQSVSGPERWLYFFSRNATRALDEYPDDWARSDWPGLERLCRCARPPASRSAGTRRAVVAAAEA